MKNLMQARSRRAVGNSIASTISRTLAPGVPVAPGTVSAVDPDLRFLVERTTMGFSLGAYFDALALGWDGYVEQQLDTASIDDSDLDGALAMLPSLWMSAPELFQNYPDGQVATVFFELQLAVVLRTVYSRRQLFERMVEFWTDHFNVAQTDDLAYWLKTVDDREVARRHALGTFGDLLLSSARSPAMVWYLDNYANVAGAPQENYARELLELHTLGVDGPYTEQDVREVARCFTGWTIEGFHSSGPFGQFVFVPQIHDNGPKRVLGYDIPAGGGVRDGEIVLEILAQHPATARFVAGKLCRWLLAYEPPQYIVDRATQTFLDTGGDLRRIVRSILRRDAVHAVPAAERPKLRRPFHFAVSLLRASFVATSDPLAVTGELFPLGQVPFYWPAPNGYPDSLPAWGSAVLPRWTFASRLFGGDVPGNVPDAGTLQALLLLAPPGSSVAAAIDFVLTGGRMQLADVAEVQSFLDDQPAVTEPVLREAFALAASSPSYAFY